MEQSAMSKKPEPKKPVHRVKSGAIEATIWENDGREGTFLSFTLGRLYKIGNEWKTSASYGQRNAADVGAAAMMAATWIAAQEAAALPEAHEAAGSSNGGGSGPPSPPPARPAS